MEYGSGKKSKKCIYLLLFLWKIAIENYIIYIIRNEKRFFHGMRNKMVRRISGGK
jgi:hypothetical protein